MEESELQRRRPVFLDRSDLFMGGRRDELPLSAVPHIAPRRARYLTDLNRQHQQPPHHECRVPARPAPRPSQALGAREVGRRRIGQQTVQRLCPEWAADDLLSTTEYSLDPSRAERRIRFRRRTRSAEPRLPQYRAV